MHKFESQPAYILHARPYQESSLLLELFSRDFGRIAAIARGAKRKIKGRKGGGSLQGVLQPFVPLLISCSGKGELLTLTSFDSEAAYPMLMGRRLVSALYLNELLMRLLYRWDAHPDFFYVYGKTLQKLNTEEQNRCEQTTLRLFEKALLRAIGYELQLTKEVDTGDPLHPDKLYFFNPEQGPCCVLEYPRNSPNQRKLIFKGKSLLDLEMECLLDPISLQDAKRLMREALGRHLGNRPLETRKLFL
jgi:DNA repair protein RecO (recombination protein O)